VVIVPGVEVSPNREAAPAGPRILVIDRQPLFGAAISHLLGTSDLKARTIIAIGSEAALEFLRSEPVDLILCGAHVQRAPLKDFLDAVAELPDPPPIMLLGDLQDEETLVAAINSEVAGLFTKDAEPRQFLEGVRAVLAGHRALGQNVMRVLVARLNGEPSSQTPARLAQLSPTELDILAMVGEASSVQAIAAARGISQKTVRNHMANIYRKLELRSRTQAMLCAARMGLTSR
jgi:DNA-binding NarL/FixJ family response regulator